MYFARWMHIRVASKAARRPAAAAVAFVPTVSTTLFPARRMETLMLAT
jgi:hypothetical protein